MVAFFLLQYTMANNEIPELLLNRYFVILDTKMFLNNSPLVMPFQSLETRLIHYVPIYTPQVHV